jgi:hypothetical protein
VARGSWLVCREAPVQGPDLRPQCPQLPRPWLVHWHLLHPSHAPKVMICEEPGLLHPTGSL